MRLPWTLQCLRAIEGDNAETINKIDLLLSRKLSELKATKEKREDAGGLQTTPAEWMAGLLVEYRKITGGTEKQKN